MSKIRALMVSLSLFLLSIGHTALPPEEPEGLKILQAKSAPAIDGDLADWADIPDFPVPFTPEGNALPPSADLTVRARFSFDSEYFYGALQVLDDRIEFPDMKRPEGDGFYLTFISPGPEPSKDDCVIFGFSLFGNEPLAIIDTRGEGGVTPARDVQLQLKLDSRRSTVDYELAIPWKRIPFFRPFLPGRLKLNLSYDDLDAGQKKVVQLVPDPEYAPESAVPKKGLSAEFVLGPPRILEFQSSLNANHFYADSALKLE